MVRAGKQEPSGFWKRMRKNNYFIVRYDRTLELRRGFTLPDSMNGFRGSPEKWYARFRSTESGRYSVGITVEQDPGEEFQWDPSRRL